MAAEEDGHVTLEPEEARQAKKLGAMRYVLGISLALAVIAGILIFASFAHH